MKKITFCIICSFSFVLINCDPGFELNIDIVNNSSYDLRVIFNMENRTYLQDNYVIDVKKSNSIKILFAGGYYDPNDIVDNIIFNNLDTNETIKIIMVNDYDNLFKVVESERYKIMSGGKATFILEINNNLFVAGG